MKELNLNEKNLFIIMVIAVYLFSALATYFTGLRIQRLNDMNKIDTNITENVGK